MGCRLGRMQYLFMEANRKFAHGTSAHMDTRHVGRQWDGQAVELQDWHRFPSRAWAVCCQSNTAAPGESPHQLQCGPHQHRVMAGFRGCMFSAEQQPWSPLTSAHCRPAPGTPASFCSHQLIALSEVHKWITAQLLKAVFAGVFRGCLAPLSLGCPPRFPDCSSSSCTLTWEPAAGPGLCPPQTS